MHNPFFISNVRMSQPLALWVGLSIAGLFVLSGCKSPAERSRVLTKDQEKQISANLLQAAPKLQYPLAVNFDNKINLLGFDLSAQPQPGKRFDLTLYFKVNQAVVGDWKIFVLDLAKAVRIRTGEADDEAL